MLLLYIYVQSARRVTPNVHRRRVHFGREEQGVGTGPPKSVDFGSFWNTIAPYGHISCTILTKCVTVVLQSI